MKHLIGLFCMGLISSEGVEIIKLGRELKLNVAIP